MPNAASRPNFRQLSRIKKLWRSSGSWAEFRARVAEELYCTLCDREFARRVLATFKPQREPEKWVFIVGCYNSGTTLLQKVLSAHPAISGIPREGVRFTTALSNLELNNHHMFWDDSWRSVACPSPEDSASVAAAVKKDWSIFWNLECEVFLEKSIANTARIEWLNQNFPNAHFIGLYRNGYCIAEGLHRRSRPPEWLVEKTGELHYPLSMAAEQWVTTNEAMLEGLRCVDKKMTLSFEDFVEDPAGKTIALFEFIGVTGSEVSMSNGVMRVGTQEFTVRNTNTASLERLGERASQIKATIEPMKKTLEELPVAKASTHKKISE